MSTDKQAKLPDYTPASPEDDQQPSARHKTRERPSWAPDEDDATGGVCLNCESHVTSDFQRVCGDNNDDAHHCPRCISGAALAAGAAADPDYQHYHDRGEPKR